MDELLSFDGGESLSGAAQMATRTEDRAISGNDRAAVPGTY
ncbi:MAG: hypothetical protein JWN43_1284, partial [Gammaproteobacteria bacterium]|nr:hypothetical protein [Gammaproteobacteria bacterium]